MERVVLDAWALLAWLQDEAPAAGEVDALLQRASRGEVEASMSIVNAGEVVYRSARAHSGRDGERIKGALHEMPFKIVPASDERVWAAVALKGRYPISYADAFAATLAQERGAVLWSGDPDFGPLAADGLLSLQRLSRERDHPR